MAAFPHLAEFYGYDEQQYFALSMRSRQSLLRHMRKRYEANSPASQAMAAQMPKGLRGRVPGYGGF